MPGANPCHYRECWPTCAIPCPFIARYTIVSQSPARSRHYELGPEVSQTTPLQNLVRPDRFSMRGPSLGRATSAGDQPCRDGRARVSPTWPCRRRGEGVCGLAPGCGRSPAASLASCELKPIHRLRPRSSSAREDAGRPGLVSSKSALSFWSACRGRRARPCLQRSRAPWWGVGLSGVAPQPPRPRKSQRASCRAVAA